MGGLALQAEGNRWLSRLFWNVPTAELLNAYGDVLEAWGDCDDLEPLVCRLGNELADILNAEDGLRRLSIDYTGLFCSTRDGAPFPYESVYEDGERLLMRPVRDEVLAAYVDNGYQPMASDGNEPEDHLSLELDFIAWLMDAEASAEDVGDDARAAALHAVREAFAAKHPAKWAPSFAKEVEEQAELPVYPAAAALVAALLS